MDAIDKLLNAYEDEAESLTRQVDELTKENEELKRTISQYEQPVEYIDIPDFLRKQAGDEIDMNNKRSDL